MPRIIMPRTGAAGVARMERSEIRGAIRIDPAFRFAHAGYLLRYSALPPATVGKEHAPRSCIPFKARSLLVTLGKLNAIRERRVTTVLPADASSAAIGGPRARLAWTSGARAHGSPGSWWSRVLGAKDLQRLLGKARNVSRAATLSWVGANPKELT
jgi:hypothetical protein